MAEFKLPDVGEGLTEAEIVSWKVAPGDAVAINDVICEIETAKSLVELPSPHAGTVGELLVSEGATELLPVVFTRRHPAAEVFEQQKRTRNRQDFGCAGRSW